MVGNAAPVGVACVAAAYAPTHIYAGLVLLAALLGM